MLLLLLVLSVLLISSNYKRKWKFISSHKLRKLLTLRSRCSQVTNKILKKVKQLSCGLRCVRVLACLLFVIYYICVRTAKRWLSFSDRVMNMDGLQAVAVEAARPKCSSFIAIWCNLQLPLPFDAWSSVLRRFPNTIATVQLISF